MITLLLIAAGLLAIAAIAKAAVDILTHQAGNNIFEAWGGWWDARTSWKRKYKDYDRGDQRPAFWLSTGPLVLLTDFWHLADFVYLTCFLVGGVQLGLALVDGPWWWPVVAIAAVKVWFGAVFELCYRKWFRK